MGKKKLVKAAESDSDMEFNMEDDYMSDELEQVNSDGSDEYENDNGVSDDENDNGVSDDDNDNGMSDDENDNNVSDDENDNGMSDDENDNEFSDSDEDDLAVDEEAQRGVEMEELEKEYKELKDREQDILSNLKGHKDEDYQKGQAIKNQMALWHKTLETRISLQKAYTSSNRLPQEPVRSSFCEAESEVSEAYSDLVASSKKTLNSILELQQALIENNPSVAQAAEVSPPLKSNANGDTDEEWSQISQMQSRMSSFRNKSIDKWQKKTQLTTGAAVIKDKLHAFNQNVSDQVASYMRDPSKMIKGMQQNRSAVAIFGNVSDSSHDAKLEENANGDPELLDDSDFYQQLLKEFFESVDPSGLDGFYAMKGQQTKKRKIVDRRASKSRKIRYQVHEKIVNFMAPRPADVPPMATQLFGDLFGLKRQKPASAA